MASPVHGPDPIVLTSDEGGNYISASNLTEALDEINGVDSDMVLTDPSPVWLSYTETPQEFEPVDYDGPGWVAVRPPADGQASDGCRPFWHFDHHNPFETVRKQREKVAALPHSRLRLTGNLAPGAEHVELVTDAGSYPLLQLKSGEPPRIAPAEKINQPHGRRWQRTDLIELAERAYTDRGRMASEAIKAGDTALGATRISSVHHPTVDAIETMITDRHALLGVVDDVMQMVRYLAEHGEGEAKALCQHLVDAHFRETAPLDEVYAT